MIHNSFSNSFNKIPLFSTDLITFIISFISLFVGVIPEPITEEISLLIFSVRLLVSAFLRSLGMSLFDLGLSLFLIKSIAVVYFIAI